MQQDPYSVNPSGEIYVGRSDFRGKHGGEVLIPRISLQSKDNDYRIPKPFVRFAISGSASICDDYQ